ncbi:MFS transporter [Pseudomonas sp. S37]|nr:MFS transporter [Pseudomonas sp. S37]
MSTTKTTNAAHLRRLKETQKTIKPLNRGPKPLTCQHEPPPLIIFVYYFPTENQREDFFF